ncbi:MAG: SEL1-like repeat protein [Akkermansia sp.]|nr:SEL1-like repeat protein [Akkermansia sp.]
MLSDNELRPVRAICSKMLLHRNMLPLLAALLLVGCKPKEQQPQSEAAEHAGQAATPPVEQPAESPQKPATQTPDEVTPEPSLSSEEPQAPEPAWEPAPEPMPILVKAGGVQPQPTAEETAAAERERYAAPTDGPTPLLRNLYGGVEVQLPDSLYRGVEAPLATLREILTPWEYLQLLQQVRYCWEKGQRGEEYKKTVPELRKLLEKVIAAPQDDTLFPRVQVLSDVKAGTVFRPLARYAIGQMHYADERVLVSLNNTNRENPEFCEQVINHFWDTRTEKLLLRTQHPVKYGMPVRVDKDSYVMWWGGPYKHEIKSIGGYFDREDADCDSVLNPQTGTVMPVSPEAKRCLPNAEESAKYTWDEELVTARTQAYSKAAAPEGLGVKLVCAFPDGEGIGGPGNVTKIVDTCGSGTELRYRNCWGEGGILDLLSLTHTKISAAELAAFSVPESVVQKTKENICSEEDATNSNLELPDESQLQLRYYPSATRGVDYIDNESLLRESIQWPITLAATSYQECYRNRPGVLKDWCVSIGSRDTIAFMAFVPAWFFEGYTTEATGESVYTGVWHKGKTWFFAVPPGQERVQGVAPESPVEDFHGAVRGVGRLVPLEEVVQQPKRDPELLSWEDCGLLVTEPGGTDDCTYLLIGGTNNVNRLRVNFNAGTVEYLESWPVKGCELSTVWLDAMRLLLLPDSDNHYRMIRMQEDGAVDEIGALYLTESDGYAIVLKDGRYTGSPGCEAFLDACDGRQLLNMRALAPWRNRPAEVLEVLGGNKEDIAALRATTQRWLRRLGYDPDNMPAEPELAAFPIAEVTLPELFTNEDTLSVPVRLRATAHDICRLQVLRDGALVPQPQIGESDSAGEREVTVQVPLAPGQNWIEVTPVDAEGIAGETTRFRIIRRGGYAANLFVVALGVADYDDDSLDLQYAAKDARDMAKAWADCSGMQTRTLVLTDKEVRDASVLEKIKGFLSASTSSDKVVFYVAGHGMLDSNMDYYYAPATFDVNRVKETGISADALMDCLDSSAAQMKLLLMDTCHAGELGEAGEEKMALAMEQLPPGVRAIQHRGMKVRKTAMSYAARKRYIEEMFSIGSTRRGINMLTASAGAEYALETSEMQNGVYTASIIEALREPAWRDSDSDGILRIDELFPAVQEAVEKRTGGMQKPSVSMLENRGYNEIAYHPGYYILRGEWDRAISMLRKGIRLSADGKVRRKSIDPHSSDNFCGWLHVVLARKLPMDRIEEILSAGLDGKTMGAGQMCSLILNEALSQKLPMERVEALISTVLDCKTMDSGQMCSCFNCTTESDKLLEIFIRQGADVNKLMMACFGNENHFNRLLQLGADVDARDEQGSTLLMRCWSLDEEKALRLLQHGADVNAQDNQGRTALMLTTNEGVARVLLSHGADCNLRDNEGQSALDHHPSSYDNVRKVIEEYRLYGDETSGLNAAQIRELGVDYAEARKGKTKDESRAIQLYIKAADMGDMKAQRWMGWRYRQGRGVAVDEYEARKYFRMAAEQGDSAAAEAIGVSVPGSSVSSGRAETDGLSAAQVRELGVDYAEARKGKVKNESRAIQLYIKAAEMGDMKAQRWMGWRYRQGRGVPKDEARARAYFSAAARQGDSAAAKALQQ